MIRATCLYTNLTHFLAVQMIGILKWQSQAPQICSHLQCPNIHSLSTLLLHFLCNQWKVLFFYILGKCFVSTYVVLMAYWLWGFDWNRVGIEIPKIEVRFQNLSVEGDAYVGTRALPTLLNSSLNAIEVISVVYQLLFLPVRSELNFFQL